MAADRDAGVDPRFDPVFQRGYDPAKHGGRRPVAAPRHATGGKATAENRVTPVRDTATLDDATPAAASGARSRPGAAPIAAIPDPDPDPDADTDPDADAPPRGRNPFRLALLLASITATGGAVLLIWNRIEENPYYQGFSGTDVGLLFGAQLREAALVPLLTGGLLGFCLWLAIGAVAPRGRDDE